LGALASTPEPRFPSLSLAQPRTAWYGAQREPAVPKELLDRVGAWAEKYLAEPREFTALETRSETHWARNGRTESRPGAVSRYTVRRSPETATRLVESRELLKPEEARLGGPAPSKSGATPARSPFEHLASPGALVSRLSARNQEKMKYFFAEDATETASEHVLLGYRQIDGPGLVAFEGKTFAPSGQAWVDPNDGRIARIEEEFAHKNARYSTAVEFARNELMNAWLPSTLTVRIFEKGRLTSQVVYTYTDFHPLEASARTQSSSP